MNTLLVLRAILLCAAFATAVAAICCILAMWWRAYGGEEPGVSLPEP